MEGYSSVSCSKYLPTCPAAVEFCSHGYVSMPCFWVNADVTSDNWLIQVMSHHCMTVNIPTENLYKKMPLLYSCCFSHHSPRIHWLVYGHMISNAGNCFRPKVHDRATLQCIALSYSCPQDPAVLFHCCTWRECDWRWRNAIVNFLSRIWYLFFPPTERKSRSATSPGEEKSPLPKMRIGITCKWRLKPLREKQ